MEFDPLFVFFFFFDSIAFLLLAFCFLLPNTGNGPRVTRKVG